MNHVFNIYQRPLPPIILKIFKKNNLTQSRLTLNLFCLLKHFYLADLNKVRLFLAKLKQRTIFIILPPYAWAFATFKTVNSTKTNRISLILWPKSANVISKLQW